MNELLIGVATVDITPPVGAYLFGYGARVSTSVGHPLRAEALVCRNAQAGWALVTTDLVGLARPFVQRLRAAIAAKVALAPESILITANHTHSGPAGHHAGWMEQDHPDREYLATLGERLVDVAVEAFATARPGRFEVAVTEAPDLASNRRVQDADGTWRNEWADPDGTHTGYFDPTVSLVGVRRDDGPLEALLVVYGCHPVVLGRGSTATSADYCGYLKDALEQSGAAGTVLFGVGGHGNIDPRVCVQDSATVAEKMGRDLAATVRRALDDLEPVDGGGIAFRQEPWNIRRTRTLDAPPLEQHMRVSRAGETFDTEVSAVRAGELAIVTLPGEAFSEVVAVVRAASSFAHTVVLSLGNDFIGYIPTDAAQRQGGHEAKYAPAEDIEGPAVQAAAAALRGLR